jgi:Spy/CpxP family protein refolding chaperone
MSRVKMFLTIGFVLAMGAGVAVGMLGAKYPQTHQPRSWLGDELGLSPDQREQMRSIWQDVSKSGQRDWGKRRALEKEKTEAVLGLLTPEQKAKYDELNRQYQQKAQEISQQREANMQDAIERTKAMLTPQQRERYEQIMQERREKRDRDRENKENNNGGSHRGPATSEGARASRSK